MRTVEDLEQMIHHTARIRLSYFKTSSIEGVKTARISAWPNPMVIYLHPDWLDERRASDDEVRDCLLRELGHRKDWLYNTLNLMVAAGFILIAIALAGLGFFNVWLSVTDYQTAIKIGLACLFSGILLRNVLLYGFLERRAERFGQTNTPEKS